MTSDLGSPALTVGATAADPRNAVTIWNAIRAWFVAKDLPIEYALFSSYNALCGALLRGEIDIAWNAPMAHAQSLLVSGGSCRTLAMCDTDQDVTTGGVHAHQEFDEAVARRATCRMQLAPR